MGHEKDRLIQEDDQGWRFTGGTVCDGCLSDPYLRSIARENAKRDECSFCGRVGRKKPIAIPFNDLMEVIGQAIFQYYDHAENEAIAWDQEDQAYVGSTYDTWELVHDELPTPSERGDVIQKIVDSLGDNTWCDKNPYAITGAERYTYSWEEFCNTGQARGPIFLRVEGGGAVFGENTCPRDARRVARHHRSRGPHHDVGRRHAVRSYPPSPARRGL
jgi:hypothetical protein